MQDRKKVKISLNFMSDVDKIDETHLNILHGFLTNELYKNANYFSPDISYPLTFKHPVSNIEEYYDIELDRLLVKRESTKNTSYVKYDVLPKTSLFKRLEKHERKPKHLIGSGTYKDVYKQEAIITLTEDKLLYKINNSKKKSEKDFLMELIHENDTNKILHEYQMDQRITDTKAKPITFFEENDVIKSSARVIAFFDGEPLSCFLRDLVSDKLSLDENKKWQLSYNLLKALENEHQNKLINNDIQPNNILVNRETLKVKIIDRGFAHKIGEKPEYSGGVLFFYSPERIVKYLSENQSAVPSNCKEYFNNEKVVKEIEISEKSDYYAMGLILEMLWNVKNSLYFKNLKSAHNINYQKSIKCEHYFENTNVLAEHVDTMYEDNYFDEIFHSMTSGKPESREFLEIIIKKISEEKIKDNKIDLYKI